MDKDILKVRKRLLIAGIAAFFALGIMSFAISSSAPVLYLSPERLSGAPEDTSDYISFDVNSIIGFYAKEVKGKNPDPQVKYALVPAGDKLITVCIPSRYFQSANTVYNASIGSLKGNAPGFDKYFTVKGTLTTLGSSEKALLDDWMALNSEQMQNLGIMGQNSSRLLSDYVIRTDTIGGVSNAWAVSFSCISLVFILFACILLIMSVLYWNKPSVFLDGITGFFTVAEPKPDSASRGLYTDTPASGTDDLSAAPDLPAESGKELLAAGVNTSKTETKEETDA